MSLNSSPDNVQSAWRSNELTWSKESTCPKLSTSKEKLSTWTSWDPSPIMLVYWKWILQGQQGDPLLPKDSPVATEKKTCPLWTLRAEDGLLPGASWWKSRTLSNPLPTRVTSKSSAPQGFKRVWRKCTTLAVIWGSGKPSMPSADNTPGGACTAMLLNSSPDNVQSVWRRVDLKQGVHVPQVIHEKGEVLRGPHGTLLQIGESLLVPFQVRGSSSNPV